MIRLGPLHLLSNDVSKLSSFLSYLFDLNISHSSDGVVLTNDDGECWFVLRQIAGRFSTTANCTINFSVDSKEELDDFIKKLSFLGFVGQSIGKRSKKEMTYFEKSDEFKYLNFTDLDHRQYRIVVNS